MKTFYSFFISVCAIATVSSCYKPDLGKEPFLCGPENSKRCPDGYSCTNRAGQFVCVEESLATQIPDAGNQPQPDIIPSKEGPVFLDGSLVKQVAGCVDESSEPNNSGTTAVSLPGKGFTSGWEICYPGDVDHYAISVDAGQTLTVTVTFKHAQGDLDAAMVDAKGFVVRESRGESDSETMTVPPPDKKTIYTLGVYGFGSVTNQYNLDVKFE